MTCRTTSGLLENAAEFFGLTLKRARDTIREVADVTRTWQEALHRGVEVALAVVCNSHSLGDALKRSHSTSACCRLRSS
ncbi:hypothetical protein DF021_28345 [Burkholderia stagnalis]|uniref:Uncharacterized protein n=1 Tax=Burkholderia stagnalis TaxID=1503054 RepID=A0ABX9YHP5_9BURK|nr:hypothetical protein DF158_14825 [Burkholderia stagnalis]RQQ68751.1 hypothetical protein DF137_16040 [Burkholderia stagnalis]RQQ70173.1 hypothetical protein DF139_13860 [Burkholderia stagnalis]RQQ80945.1 hypothetical protein DF138_14440 [Burkholderia stagnalis]RQQ86678.1 hypothetical protein DF134_23345 [Burkholderia stagnalis]